MLLQAQIVKKIRISPTEQAQETMVFKITRPPEWRGEQRTGLCSASLFFSHHSLVVFSPCFETEMFFLRFFYSRSFYIYLQFLFFIHNKNADFLLLLCFACTRECCRKHTTLSCKMEKGGGNGFSLPSKEPKSSLKSCKDALHYSTCIFPCVSAISIFIKEETLMGFD